MKKPEKKAPAKGKPAKDKPAEGLPTPDAATRERWEAAAAKVPADAPRANVPWSVLMDEAVDLARFVRNHWDPKATGLDGVRPGLSAIADRFPKGIADELLELQHLAERAHTAYILATSPLTPEKLFDKGEAALTELDRALDFHFDDGVFNEGDAQLAKLREAHPDPRSHAAMASALMEYAALAEAHREGLSTVGTFDLKTIEEARALAQGLRDLPSVAERARPTEDGERQRALRDGFAALLVERIRRVRSAARWVFRAHPEVVKLSTSAYERRRRADSRREKVKAEEKKAEEKKKTEG